MKHLIAILVLLALVAVPVCAATGTISQYSHKLTASSTWQADLDLEFFKISNATNTTKVNIAGYGYDYGRASMPVCTGTWRKDGVNGLQIATGTMAWSTSARNSYSAPAIWNLTFENWNIGVYNASMKLVFRNDTTCSKYNLISFIRGVENGTGYYTTPKVEVMQGSGGVVSIFGNVFIPAPPTAVYSCNFNPAFPYEQSPFGVVCTDNSSAYPALTSQEWSVTAPDASTYVTTNASLVRTLSQYGWYGLDYEACNAVGCGYSNASQWLNLSATAPPATGISLNVDIKDAAFPYAYIQGASFGIQNTTNDEWGNTTAAFGALELVDILGIPLSQGQTVQICAGATGYQDACDTFAIPYDGYLATLHLTKENQIPSSGNWNLIVKTIQNLDHKPVSATVEVITGVSGPGVYSGGTDASTGTVSFMNISASTTATITVIAQAYQPASKTIPVIANSTQTVTFELVRIGQTPVSTPIIPTTTTTYSSPSGSAPVPTNPSTGLPITEAEEYAEFGIMELVKMVPTWINLLIGIISMAFMWGALYWMRGGKYRKKGRGGWI